MELSTLNKIVFCFFTEKYRVEGKLQITQPMLNYHPVTKSDLIDKSSMDYIFLMAICTDIVSTKMCLVSK